ncbi:MAG TPA: hypothetical protein DFR83_16525, partial [Deltaproteobacteria bacterium]|nr:hypothetical protein [Deltaproteobacteria bacterium]
MTLRPIQLLATLALSAALPTSVLASTSGATAQPSTCATCDAPFGLAEHAPDMDAGSTGTAHFTDFDYYVDDDSDGYGTGDVAQTGTDATAPSGYSLTNDDCDDTDENVNPGASEVCDGVDNNCSGTADDGLTFVDYYPDTDGDGYGDEEGTPVNDCAMPSAYVEDNTDCDDSDADVNPGATEIEDDSIDQDCDGEDATSGDDGGDGGDDGG